MLEWVLGLLTIFLLPSILRFAYQKLRQLYYISKIPGPYARPLLGNVPDFTGSSFQTLQFMMASAEEAVKGGHNVMRVWLGLRPVVLTLSGEAPIIESSEELSKGKDYGLLEQWLGTGLLLSTGPKWKSRRRMLTPTFHFSMLDGYVYKMDKHAKILVDILDRHVGEEIDFFPFIKRCALDIICDTAMGKELNAQQDLNNPYTLAVAEYNILAREHALNPRLSFPPYWYDLVITERMRGIASGEITFEDGERKQRKAFLDLLIEMKENSSLSFEDIREEVDTFMFEGHDTTSSGVAWAVWCLATNPECQQKAYEEIKSIFGDDIEGECTVENIKSMVYIDRVIKETLRMYPAVPLFGRFLQNDMKLGGFLIPGGTDVMGMPALIHHNSKVYRDHWKFNPDNFLSENVSARHAYDFIPFSAGPRNCIGQKFAMYEEKLIVATILRRFSIHADKNMLDNKAGPEVVMKPLLGIPVTFKRRH